MNKGHCNIYTQTEDKKFPSTEVGEVSFTIASFTHLDYSPSQFLMGGGAIIGGAWMLSGPLSESSRPIGYSGRSVLRVDPTLHPPLVLTVALDLR